MKMFLWKCLYQVRAIAVFTVFRLLTDCVCLLINEFCLSLWKIARCSVILLLPLFKVAIYVYRNQYMLENTEEVMKNGQRNWQHRVHMTKKKKEKKSTHNIICVGHDYAQICKNNIIRHEPSYKQLEVKTNRTSFLCRNHNGHDNTELERYYV